MLGSPIPRIMQVTMVNTSVNRRLFPPMLIMVFAIFSAKPVIEQTPTIQPTHAQAIATETVDFAAAAIASRISCRLIRVFFLTCATMIVKMIV